MSDRPVWPAEERPAGRRWRRPGPQQIPRPATWSVGPGPWWSRSDAARPDRLTVADVRAALDGRGPPAHMLEEIPVALLPGRTGRAAAVLCALFDESMGVDQGVQAHVVLTRRSANLRTHTHQVSFPGGRIDPGEEPRTAALREAQEEVGLEPATVEIIGELPKMRTVVNPAPITPFVAALPSRPLLRPNPAEVERAFTVPLVELAEPDVYREELWAFPDGSPRPMHFFELDGDTVWGATARMLHELLDLVIGTRSGQSGPGQSGPGQSGPGPGGPEPADPEYRERPLPETG